MKNIEVWSEALPKESYRLVDSGEGEKLEEIGGVRIVRNEPRAWWSKKEAGSWNLESRKKEGLEKIIDIGLGGIKAKIKFKPSSKHIGIFPEQLKEWQYIATQIRNPKHQIRNREINLLNLFGYTGMASLVAAQAGAKVTHVDAVKQTVDWARENQKLSGLQDAPIRWIVDDALKFVKQEIKRGVKYDALIMDPPSYGKGPKGEVWKIEEKLPELLKACHEVLSEQPLFIIINMYSTELSSLSLQNLLSEMTAGLNGSVTCGELALPHATSDRLLPMSIFALWQAS